MLRRAPYTGAAVRVVYADILLNTCLELNRVELQSEAAARTRVDRLATDDGELCIEVYTRRQGVVHDARLSVQAFERLTGQSLADAVDRERSAHLDYDGQASVWGLRCFDNRREQAADLLRGIIADLAEDASHGATRATGSARQALALLTGERQPDPSEPEGESSAERPMEESRVPLGLRDLELEPAAGEP